MEQGSTGRWAYARRRAEAAGSSADVNIQEKNAFQAGRKCVAILSEAASTGISLQSDRRVRN